LVAGFALCLLGQGFFSGSEIALVSADRLKLRAEADRGSQGAAAALSLLDRPATLLGTCLIGTNLAVITAATLATWVVTQHLALHETWAAVLALPLTLTFGEMVPKALYQHHADRLAPIVAVPLRAVGTVLLPVLWLLDRLTRLFGAQAGQTHTVSRDEIRLLLEGAQDDALKPGDKEVIERVFAFTESSVEEAMVPLIYVVAVPETASIADAARRVAETGLSRLPVYRERIDRITGVVLHGDLLRALDWTAPVSSVARRPLFVPESKPVDALLREMRRAQHRMAVAVDEYGGAVGIITVEDLLEEIVGEIHDESDRARALVRRVSDREWLVAGRAEREHIREATGVTLPDGDFETVAGYVLSMLGRVPRAGESVQVDGATITVKAASDRAILEVSIIRGR
jgi:CBS domain containing-hemolysin-like protein